MAIFFVSFDFELTKKPRWLDDFRKKYDYPYPFHITLKLNTYTRKENIEQIKEAVAKTAAKYKPLDITFNKIKFDKTKTGYAIMLNAKKNENLLSLQSEIKSGLSKFGRNLKAYHEVFENNFTPHITIARRLKKRGFEKAKAELGNDIVCKAYLEIIDLSIMKKATFEESSDPKNKTQFRLSK